MLVSCLLFNCEPCIIGPPYLFPKQNHDSDRALHVIRCVNLVEIDLIWTSLSHCYTGLIKNIAVTFHNWAQRSATLLVISHASVILIGRRGSYPADYMQSDRNQSSSVSKTDNSINCLNLLSIICLENWLYRNSNYFHSPDY